MFFRAKNLDEVIKEWKKEGAEKVNILPYMNYDIKLGYMVERMNPLVLPARIMGVYLTTYSQLEFDREIERLADEEYKKSKGKFKGVGNIYFPDKGRIYNEFKKKSKDISSIKIASDIIKESGLQVGLYKTQELLGDVGYPWSPKLKVPKPDASPTPKFMGCPSAGMT